jgi:hypothetical protein
VNSTIGPLIEAINQTFPQVDIRLDAASVPNPFMDSAPPDFPSRNETLLRLVDGGIDGEVIPIQPMLVQARGIDVFIAIDAVRRPFIPILFYLRADTSRAQAADTEDNFSDGSSVIVRTTPPKIPCCYSSSPRHRQPKTASRCSPGPTSSLPCPPRHKPSSTKTTPSVPRSSDASRTRGRPSSSTSRTAPRRSASRRSRTSRPSRTSSTRR